MISINEKDGLPVILFETQESWEKWLEGNFTSPGIWVRLAKKGSGVQSINYQQALEVALCFGWIDGVKNALDEQTWLQRFTMRKPASKWSKVNKKKVLELIDEGRMKPSGFAVIEVSKKKGTWDAAYDSQKNAEVPDDLQTEFDKNPEAAEFFKSLDRLNRFAIIYRLQTAHTPELRSKRLTQLLEMLNRKEKIHNNL